MTRKEFVRFLAAVIVSFVATLAAAVVSRIIPPAAPASTAPPGPIPFPQVSP